MPGLVRRDWTATRLSRASCHSGRDPIGPPRHASTPSLEVMPVSDQSTLPAWFRDAFEQALTRLGWRLVRWQERSATVADSKSANTTYGVENILRLTAALPEDRRLDRIVEHLNKVNSIREPGSLGGARER